MLGKCFSFVALVIAVALPVLGEPQVPVERKAESVGPWAYKRIERMHADLQDERFDYVIDTLDEMKRNDRLNAHERALMWQGYGYAYIGQEDYEKAADALANCLASEGLPFQAELHTRYNLAQILVMLERPEEAIAEFDKWFPYARKPSPSAYYMAAMAHMQAGHPRRAIEYVDIALANSARPKESWLQLKNAMLVEEKDYEAAEEVLGRLIELFPKKAYWMQLAAIYSETKRPDRALTTLEMVYLQGWLEKESEYLTLAQMYLFNQIPYQAAEVLRDGLDKGHRQGQLEVLAAIGGQLVARARARARPAADAEGRGVGEGRQRLLAVGAVVRRTRGVGRGARRIGARARKGRASPPRPCPAAVGNCLCELQPGRPRRACIRSSAARREDREGR